MSSWTVGKAKHWNLALIKCKAFIISQGLAHVLKTKTISYFFRFYWTKFEWLWEIGMKLKIPSIFLLQLTWRWQNLSSKKLHRHFINQSNKKTISPLLWNAYLCPAMVSRQSRKLVLSLIFKIPTQSSYPRPQVSIY